jgi:hypothetical protein
LTVRQHPTSLRLCFALALVGFAAGQAAEVCFQDDFKGGLGEGDGRPAGECDLPAHGAPKGSLQVYQGLKSAERWAHITEFCVSRPGR